MPRPALPAALLLLLAGCEDWLVRDPHGTTRFEYTGAAEGAFAAAGRFPGDGRGEHVVAVRGSDVRGAPTLVLLAVQLRRDGRRDEFSLIVPDRPGETGCDADTPVPACPLFSDLLLDVTGEDEHARGFVGREGRVQLTQVGHRRVHGTFTLALRDETDPATGVVLRSGRFEAPVIRSSETYRHARVHAARARAQAGGASER